MATTLAASGLSPHPASTSRTSRPVTGKTFCEIPRSNAQDIDRALDAAHAARASWGHTSPTQRAIIMNQIAQRMEDNLDLLALAET